MKNLLCFLLLSILTCGCVYGLENADDLNKISYLGVICTPNKKMCTVGNHTLRSNTELFVQDGIVCSPNRKTCTNGYKVMKSSEPIEIVAAYVICTKNRKMCTVGNHTLRSFGSPLFVRDGIICTSNKKSCTNGFKMMHSSEELYE